MKNPLSFMNWLCISTYGIDRRLVIDATLNDRKFIERDTSRTQLSTFHQVPLSQQCFIYYSTGYLHSKIIKKWCRTKSIELSWPRNSPDLNPIENMLQLLKTLARKRYLSNKKELKLTIVS
ncbi:transposable element Tcb1 transposase [Trichonephila clavipes]|nr:transposable element Tcb1 transposase [Trichonephila clavipes]